MIHERRGVRVIALLWFCKFTLECYLCLSSETKHLLWLLAVGSALEAVESRQAFIHQYEIPSCFLHQFDIVALNFSLAGSTQQRFLQSVLECQ